MGDVAAKRDSIGQVWGVTLRILYCPCHVVLEFDQIQLWHELGHEIVSLGSYINPAEPHDAKRPPLPKIPHDPELVRGVTGDAKEHLPRHLIEWADVIIIDHIPRWVVQNWPEIHSKMVVWRAIGQSTPDVENALRPYRDGLFVVRYSEREERIMGYIGCDALIPFHKDPDEFTGWTGEYGHVITVAQHMKARKEFCHYDVFEQATRKHPRKLYGPGNGDAPMWCGELNYEEMKWALRDHRAFFYTGTQPASYTLALIEAMMTGIPVVAAGPHWMDDLFRLGLYEIPDIIQNGVNGMWSDEIGPLRDGVSQLLTDDRLAREIGQAGRQTAIERYGKTKVKELWDDFFHDLS